ncbi:MAG: PAS domain S-box protein [Burkholderiaceae bacterium]
MPLLRKIAERPELYRLILDHALDSFIAIDADSVIIEWSKQAEATFGWTRDEAVGSQLSATILPERYHHRYRSEIRRYLRTGESSFFGHRVELAARRKNGDEIPVEFDVTPITGEDAPIFSISIRDISKKKGLEQELRRQATITRSILDNMADAVAVADLSGRMILINPAAQRLWNIPSSEELPAVAYHRFPLYLSDGETLCPESERPMARALRGEEVTDWIGFVRHENAPEGIWISVNARPLVDPDTRHTGAVTVYHDITELRQREQALAQQARLLREQTSLLEVTNNAILTRDCDDLITYWNPAAEKLYGYSRDEALGRNIHDLLKTESTVPLDEIRRVVEVKHHWEGQLTHEAKSGQKIVVSSQLTLDTSGPGRYLETNVDITQRLQMEQALKKTQEDYRQLVEASTEVAMIILDPAGIIVNWNAGAEKIVGHTYQEAVGQSIFQIFTPEDRSVGQPWRELEKAKAAGSELDRRWHVRKDGSRFWADGVMMPLWEEDGGLRGFAKIFLDQTAQRLAEEQTRFLANHDALTGLPNRIHLSEQLHKAIALADRNQAALAVLLLDLDRFKYVNDTFGHHAGDLLLKEVANRLRSSLRETDVVARMGGDEFLVIQADGAQPQASERLAGKLVEELERPYLLEQHEVQSGTSIGISCYPADARNMVELMKKADLALYRAKSEGRGKYRFYSADLMMEKEWERVRGERLHRALMNDEFELYYQPQVDLNSWKITTIEALLRWQASEQDMILPGDFLGVAEETGAIVEIGNWALRKACRQLMHWRQRMPDLRISLNCSARQFSDPEFVKMVGPILEETGLPGRFLELEITESMLAQPDAKRQVIALRALGVRITIDNYGTGTHALADLMQLDVDGLKIDKAFVRHLPYRMKDSAVTSSIILLARRLGINVSAGGVETPEQLAYLKSEECNSAQGFLFSPPISAGKFEELMLNGHWSRINQLPQLGEKQPAGRLH